MAKLGRSLVRRLPTHPAGTRLSQSENSDSSARSWSSEGGGALWDRGRCPGS